MNKPLSSALLLFSIGAVSCSDGSGEFNQSESAHSRGEPLDPTVCDEFNRHDHDWDRDRDDDDDNRHWDRDHDHDHKDWDRRDWYHRHYRNKIIKRACRFFADQTAGTEREIFASDLRDQMNAGLEMVLVDTRPIADFDAAHIPGAINIPLQTLFTRASIASLPEDETTPLVLISANGQASAMPAGILGTMGYNVYVLRFGMIGWVRTTNVQIYRSDRTQTIQGLSGPLE